MNKKAQQEIDRLLDYLEVLEPGTPKYDASLHAIEQLKKYSEEPKKWYKLDPETVRTLIVVLGNFGCVLMTLHYEELKTVTSRALNMMMKTTRV